MKNSRLKAENLLASLERDHPPAILESLRDLLGERFPRGRGKPKGTGVVDDSFRLKRLKELLRSGKDEKEAVRDVAHEHPGDSEKNTRRRLYRKLPEVQAEMEDPRERKKAEILRRAFEEPVETWDL